VGLGFGAVGTGPFVCLVVHDLGFGMTTPYRL
jgi:hypothetical protein